MKFFGNKLPKSADPQGCLPQEQEPVDTKSTWIFEQTAATNGCSSTETNHLCANESQACARLQSGFRILGVSLFELMLGLAVLGILTSVAVPMFTEYVDDANAGRAISDMGRLQLEIERFRLNNNRLPNDLAEIGRGGMLDPYGNPYEFTNFALSPPGARRKDHNLVPINTDYDLFSKGKDGESVPPLTAKKSRDDIVRANNGQFLGLARDY